MKSGNCRKRHSETTWTNLDRFDMMWQVTILLDCCQSSVVPLLRHSEARSLGPGPGYMPRIQLGWLTGASWNTICPFGIGQMDENTNSRQKHATQRLESTWYFEATSLQEARSTCSGTKREEDDYDILRLECHAISFNQARRSQQMLSRLRRYGCWGLDAEFLNSQDSWRILIWAFGRVKCWVQLRNVVKRSQRSQICRPGWTYHLCLVDMAWPGSRCGKIWQDMASNSKIWQDSRGQGMCERCWFDMVWHYLTMSFLLVYDVSGLEANCVSIKFPQQIFNACLTTPHELSSFWGHPPEIYGHDCNPIAQSHTITISRVCAYLHGLKLWRSVTGCDELWRVGDLVISNLWIISWRHSLHLWRRGRAWQGMAGHGWLHSVVLSPCFRSRGNSAPWECGPWWSIVQMLQLCNLSEWPGATLPVQPCQCNFVGSCQILSDLVRSCQILSHVHWAGLFEQSKSSICGLFQMPVLSRFVVSYQSKGGPVTFEFLGVTSDMDWYEVHGAVHGAGGHARCVQGAGTWAFVKARTWANKSNKSRLQCESQHCRILVLWSQTFRSRLKTMFRLLPLAILVYRWLSTARPKQIFKSFWKKSWEQRQTRR